MKRPIILYLVTEDWYFWSHRLPMARAAKAAGFDVHVASRVAEHGQRILAEGFALHPLRWDRQSLNPISESRAIAEIVSLYRRVRPDIVHHVSLKPTVFGGIAARISGVPRVVNALTGLGFVFSSKRPKARLLRSAMLPLLQRILSQRQSVLLLQNRDDRDLLTNLGLVQPERTVIIRGSGIDTEYYRPLPEPPPPITAAYVGRMLREKGVPTLVEAMRRLQSRGIPLRLRLSGSPDPASPSSIDEETLRRWCEEIPSIHWTGHCSDVREVWANAHIAVHPSRGGEGLPKCLLEAAACGRAIVATNIPGSREVASQGVNALLIPIDDAEALADALATLATDETLRTAFSKESRRLVMSDLAADEVGRQTVELYRTLLSETTSNHSPEEEPGR